MEQKDPKRDTDPSSLLNGLGRKDDPSGSDPVQWLFDVVLQAGSASCKLMEKDSSKLDVSAGPCCWMNINGEPDTSLSISIEL